MAARPPEPRRPRPGVVAGVLAVLVVVIFLIAFFVLRAISEPVPADGGRAGDRASSPARTAAG